VRRSAEFCLQHRRKSRIAAQSGLTAISIHRRAGEFDGLGPALRVGGDEGVQFAGAHDHRLGAQIANAARDAGCGEACVQRSLSTPLDNL
jgi:hypothetical protein